MTTPASQESAVIPAVVHPHSLACLRALGRRGIHTVAVCEEPSTPAFSSRYCGERHVVPAPTDGFVEYKDALLRLASRSDVRTIFPMREADTYVLSKFRSEFEEHLRPQWPRFEVLRTVHDRLRLVEAATEAGVPVPETSALDETDEWDHRQIVKARYGILTDDYVPSGAPGRAATTNAVHFLGPGTEPDRDEICTEMGHVPIVQEYIPGDEYALWALYDHGEPVATVGKRQVRARSYAGGTSIYRETAHIPQLEDAGRALLDHLDWHGFASVQFKEDAKTGKFTLMEVNPRVWISLSCPLRAGVDFPFYYWRLANGETPQVESNYDPGVGTHNLAGEVMYLLSILRDDNPFVDPPSLGGALWSVGSSLWTQPNCDYFTPDDPDPFARMALNSLSSRIRGR